MFTPAEYESWYHTPRGQWIGQQEFRLMQNLLPANDSATLLDVGCGSGYFSRRFQQSGLNVTGIDVAVAMLEYARRQSPEVNYLQGRAEELPFADNSVDYVSAVTSLCFVKSPARAVQEMWRVAKSSVILGLLNRHSLLYRQKRNSSSYHGARWDSRSDVHDWLQVLSPRPHQLVYQSAIFLPGGGGLSHSIEWIIPNHLLWGGFLAVGITK